MNLEDLRTLYAAELSAVTGLTVEPRPPLQDITPGAGVVFSGPVQPGQRFGIKGRVTLQGVVVTGTEADEATAEARVDEWAGLLLRAAMGGLPDPGPLSEHAPGGASVEPRQLNLAVDGRPLYALIVTTTLDVDL